MKRSGFYGKFNNLSITKIPHTAAILRRDMRYFIKVQLSGSGSLFVEFDELFKFFIYRI